MHVHAFPVSGGAPIFLGAAGVISRPDVATVFGQSRFANGGFAMSARLAPAVYDIAVFAHSTVSGTFTAVRAARVTVLAPASDPFMSLDHPVPQQALTLAPFAITGWALDRASTEGPGVDGVHVWAYPVSGGAPIWLGATNLGGSRPDVAAAFGGAQYQSSGFQLTTSIAERGTYDIVVWAHSAIVGQFNNSAVARVYVY